MKRRVKFMDDSDAYRFVLDGGENSSFSLNKETLSFSADDFYICFFKGIDERPDYELIQPDSELKGQAKHVYDTVAAIFKKACDSIDENWFKEQDEAVGQPLPDSDEDNF